MLAAPPAHDSVLDALGYAVRVVARPGFLWAPVLLYLILMLPLLPLYVMPGLDGTTPTFATQADVDAYLRGFVPIALAFLVLIIVVGPVASAVLYQSAQQFVDGEDPRPFGPGVVNLAWRFFLQTVVLLFAVLVAVLQFVVVFVVLLAIVGVGLAILVTVLGALIGSLLVTLRVGLAPVLLLSGAGPIEAIGRSWALTRGHLGQVFRWLVVSGVVVGIGGGVISAVSDALFRTLGLPIVGQILGTVVIAPLGLVGSIVLVLLMRLLSSPTQPPRPQPALPDWMNPDRAAADPPTTPSTDGATRFET